MYGQSSRIYFYLCLLAVFFACASTASTGKPKPKPKPKLSLKMKDGDRITNGKNATIEQFPSIVQIIDKYHSGRHGFLCGGTIVSERHVVSAAHCFNQYNKEDVAVIANATYLVGDEGAIQRDVVNIIKHEDYDRETDNNDVVVLELSEPLPFGKGVQKAKMCSESWDRMQKIVVSGWGHIRENATKHSNQLQTVKLNTLSNKECLENYKDITKNMSCSVVSKGKDACQGDSGGPAFLNGELCGIVSFGFGCGRNGVPGVFASIPRLSTFIKRAMSYLPHPK